MAVKEVVFGLDDAARQMGVPEENMTSARLDGLTNGEDLDAEALAAVGPATVHRATGASRRTSYAHGGVAGRERGSQREGGAEDVRHQSAVLTLDTCAGLFNDDLDAVAERLDAAHGHRAGTSPTEAEVIAFPK